MLYPLPPYHPSCYVISLATIPSLMFGYIPCHHTVPNVMLYSSPPYNPSCYVISLAAIPSLVFCNIPCHHTIPHVLLYPLPPYHSSCFVISLATIPSLMLYPLPPHRPSCFVLSLATILPPHLNLSKCTREQTAGCQQVWGLLRGHTCTLRRHRHESSGCNRIITALVWPRR